MKYMLMLFVVLHLMISLYSYVGIVENVLERELLINGIVNINLAINFIKKSRFLNYLDEIKLLIKHIFVNNE